MSRKTDAQIDDPLPLPDLAAIRERHQKALGKSGSVALLASADDISDLLSCVESLIGALRKCVGILCDCQYTNRPCEWCKRNPEFIGIARQLAELKGESRDRS
jgi:hypothetical protein